MKTRDEMVKDHIAQAVAKLDAAKTQSIGPRPLVPTALTDGVRYCHWVAEQLRNGVPDDEILKVGIKYFIKARPDMYKATGRVWAKGRAVAELKFIKNKLLKTNPNYGLGGCNSLHKADELKKGKVERKVPAPSLYRGFQAS